MLNLHNTNQIATLNTSLSKFIFIRLVTNPYFSTKEKINKKNINFNMETIINTWASTLKEWKL